MSDIKKDRNEELVLKRITDAKTWSWGALGKHYRISRFTARDIFERDADKYYKPQV